MLRKLIEKTTGKISDAEFRLIMDLTTIDIEVNRIGYGQLTSPKETVAIALRCHSLIQKLPNEKGPQVLAHSTDHMKNKPNEIISQTHENIPIALDSFSGTVTEFKDHLYLNRLLIENGIAV